VFFKFFPFQKKVSMDEQAEASAAHQAEPPSPEIRAKVDEADQIVRQMEQESASVGLDPSPLIALLRLLVELHRLRK
jgi:hypothetical protein